MTRYGLDMMALMHGNDGNARYGARCSFTMLHKVTGFTNVSPAKVLTMCSAHLELLGGQQAIAVGIQGLKGLPQHLPGSTESKHVETCRNQRLGTWRSWRLILRIITIESGSVDNLSLGVARRWERNLTFFVWIQKCFGLVL